MKTMKLKTFLPRALKEESCVLSVSFFSKNI
eukprot:UN06809